MDEVMIERTVSGLFGRTLLIAGGEIDFSFAACFLQGEAFDTIVGVDGGIDAAKRLGILPDYVIGDFDSASEETILMEKKRFQTRQDERIFRYPAKKDATDLHLALCFAIDHHAEDIVILGATGRRLDHFLANVHILLASLEAGIPTVIIDTCNRISLMKDRLIFKRKDLFGTYISFLPLTEKAEGISLKGFAYEISDASMQKGDSIGVSNEMGENENEAVAEVKEGILIVIESRDDPGF